MTNLDPRLNAYRPDLADAALKTVINADAYAEGRPGRVTAGRIPLLTRPADDSRMASELLFGETVSVFDIRDGWAWLQNRGDGYVGYARAENLGDAINEPTHRVSALRTFLYTAPDLKSPVLDMLSMNAVLCERGCEKGFVGLSSGGWVWAGHIAGMNEHASDHVVVALGFLGTPYLWGGRSSVGLDCSGLVQMALARRGKPAPRDSDMQESFGAAVAFEGDEAVLAQGDLIFWPGHVGIWLEGGDLLHANATDMLVARKPFATTVRQIREDTGDDITAVRRP